MPLPYYHNSLSNNYSWDPIYPKNRTRKKKIKKIFNVDKYSRQKEKSQG